MGSSIDPGQTVRRGDGFRGEVVDCFRLDPRRTLGQAKVSSQGVCALRSKLISAAAALALAAGPAAAAARTPPPAIQAPVPAAETVEGSEIRGGFILPLLVIIAVIIAVLLLTKNDDKPHSP
jgi:hypothetical protein